MILIGVAWLLVLAIALYQTLHGLFSAVIMALLTTVCAVVALGTYEWLGPAFLYGSQPAFADGLSLILHFAIPLLLLRTAFDKLIIGDAPLGGWADRTAGGLIGLYIGAVMVGILTIVLQMLPWGGTVLGYTPYDSSLQRTQRIYLDEFALGLFNSASGLASGVSFNDVHDDLLLELFCARNTAGLNGRVDTPSDALKIKSAHAPGAKWKNVVNHDKLPQDPLADSKNSTVLIVHTTVSAKARNADKKDGWYRFTGTHFRLVTGSGRSLYPLGSIVPDKSGTRWTLAPDNEQDQPAKIADRCILRKHKSDPVQHIYWVYRLPKPESQQTVLGSAEDLGPAEAKLAKAARDAKYAPSYMVFRRTSKAVVDAVTTKVLPDIPKKPDKP